MGAMVIISPKFKRVLARAVVLLAFCAVPVAAAGCGAGTHLAENVVAHKVANHFAKTPGEKRAVNKAFCLYSVYQAFKDVRHHHLVYGGATAAIAIKDCEAGFSKSAR
jgi:hypothetical protein